jgi:protein-L-isoaspartate(D-aspartate) O-methyltransferase
LIQTMRRAGVLNDEAIAAAFVTVPRDVFLPGIAPEEVYVDRAVITKRDTTGAAITSASQPTMMAEMLGQLELALGMNILEIGAGTGYNAALMQTIVGKSGRVTSLEIDAEVAEQAEENLYRAGVNGVNIVNTDGAAGYAPRAAYDRILSTAAVWDVPPAWTRQLKPRGRIVIPLQAHAAQISACLIPQPDGSLLSTNNIPCRFVLMRGSAAVPPLVRQVGSSPLTLWSLDNANFDTASLSLLLSQDDDLNHFSASPSAEEIWAGLMHYTMLNAPPDVQLATYFIPEGQQAYGLDAGSGYAIFSPASACLIPYQGGGEAYCFAGSDAFMTAQTLLDEWVSIGKPGADRLRVRLTNVAGALPKVERGRVYRRIDHDIHVWIEPVSGVN